MTKPTPIFLYAGGHSAAEKKMCFNEAIAWLAGEPHSAAPVCASPVVRRFGMALNDRLDDTRRQLLRPYVLRSLGTAGDGRDPERREMCVQWLVEHLPDLFDRAGLGDTGSKVRDTLVEGGLAEENVLRILRAARDEAWSVRNARLSELRTRVREEVRKRLAETGASDDEAVVVAAAVAEVVVAAEAAVAEVVVAAVAAEAAAAVAEVVVAAVAAEAAAAAAAAAVAEVAEAEVAAEVAAYGSSRYWKIRDAVYNKVYPVAKAKALEILGPSIDELLPSALDLFDRMLPAEPLQAPAIENAELLFAAPEEAA